MSPSELTDPTQFLFFIFKKLGPSYNIKQGIVTSSIQYYVQGYVIKATGPVFVTAFTPLRMIAVTALACIFLKEKLHLGSIVGGLVVVIGLYLVVWGKSKEQRAMASDESQGQQQLPIIVPRIDVSSG
ncbi:putative EamA domain-containing protein [Medicago truncatula]|uniref:WAT1-related protein n=1 Tax=Medicago truncatula TaxID=3880 RepID=A0A396JXL6_MEDTR|nr:putative EamA domain-containing protein [Medicago truncatula]